jgi:hypothetical protein
VTKKIKPPQKRTELDRITAQLRTVLRREITDIVLIGDLLIKARKHLDHGEWQPYLVENFDLSIRTAQRYEAAAKYAACKKQIGHESDFTNLSATVLYRLAEGGYTEQEEAEILAQAEAGNRIDQNRAWAICKKIASSDDDSGDDPDADTDADAPDDDAQAGAEAILDGPPPVLPPGSSEQLAPANFALRDFDQAIGTLKRLQTKPSKEFAGTSHDARDLESIESFIRAVMKAKAKVAA